MIFSSARYSVIPDRVPASCNTDYPQKIPKIIWQTMKTGRVPSIMKDLSESWIRNNPDYEYRFCDDDGISSFIRSHFPEYLKGFQKIKYGASRADLWRYLVMYQYGGVYADMDCRCLSPLRNWINPDSEYVTQLGINYDICQWLIISVPKNPIFLRAAEKSLQNLLNNRTFCKYKGFELENQKMVIRKHAPYRKINDRILGVAGPPVLQAAAEECFEDGSIKDILKFTQVACISMGKSCQMNGNVHHDHRNPEYIKALKSIKTPHYRHGRGLAAIMIDRLKSYYQNK